MLPFGTDALGGGQKFSMLGIKELLNAREQYHVHLMNKRNVVATAIGRYFIRSDEDWPTAGHPHVPMKHSAATKKGPRTLANSEIRPYSWPCVLVFVSEWLDPEDFGKGGFPHDDYVPSALYTPDGRVVPVCVIQAERSEAEPPSVQNLTFPETVIGGGYPIVVDVQGQEHVASIGCLVTDGHLVYAMTNRHVAGAPGETVYTYLNGDRIEVGVSSELQLKRKAFDEVYPGWAGKDCYVDMDIGLVEVHDKNQWTAQVYGIGLIGNLADLNNENMSLALIGSPVRAFGCASHEIDGAIHALFYRYKSLNGFEYLSDFLIGQRQDVEPNSPAADSKASKKSSSKPVASPAREFQTNPGDSGTLWLLETGDDRGLMPLALQWGGHVFLDGASKSQLKFALATCLSTVCRQLDVDIIRDWNIGFPEYWGAVGHYTIAAKAIDLLDDGPLKDWMSQNLELISYRTEQITDKTMKGLSTRDYVPLADVPDMVWKVGPHKRGGMKSPEHPNHFADMDKPNPKNHGKTLLELCESDMDTYVTVGEWQQYYTDVGDESRGLLPFRVWQIWNAMSKAAQDGDINAFVCAAGIVSHYVGDSCQPLHISYRFNGDPDNPVSTQVKDPQTHQWVDKDMPAGTGVHSAYEDAMVNAHIDDINTGLAATSKPPKMRSIASGSDSAKAVVELMQSTFAAIQPLDIVNKYVELQGQQLKPRQIADALWDEFGKSTVEVMRDGSNYLAHLWQSAWDTGKKSSKIGAAKTLEQQDMIDLYTDPKFLPSHTLDTIEPLLSGHAFSNGAPGGKSRVRAASNGHGAVTTTKGAANRKAGPKKAK